MASLCEEYNQRRVHILTIFKLHYKTARGHDTSRIEAYTNQSDHKSKTISFVHGIYEILAKHMLIMRSINVISVNSELHSAIYPQGIVTLFKIIKKDSNFRALIQCHRMTTGSLFILHYTGGTWNLSCRFLDL